jgi:hypothetical protein
MAAAIVNATPEVEPISPALTAKLRAYIVANKAAIDGSTHVVPASLPSSTPFLAAQAPMVEPMLPGWSNAMVFMIGLS